MLYSPSEPQCWWLSWLWVQRGWGWVCGELPAPPASLLHSTQHQSSSQFLLGAPGAFPFPAAPWSQDPAEFDPGESPARAQGMAASPGLPRVPSAPAQPRDLFHLGFICPSVPSPAAPWGSEGPCPMSLSLLTSPEVSVSSPAVGHVELLEIQSTLVLLPARALSSRDRGCPSVQGTPEPSAHPVLHGVQLWMEPQLCQQRTG